MYFIGIDPGTEPAICLLDEKGEIRELVLIKKTKFKKDSAGFNYYEVRDFFSRSSLYTSELGIKLVAYIEDVHSVYGSSAKANFNFGGSRFALEQSCVDHNIPTVGIQPKMWQKYLWIEEDIQMKRNGKKGKDTKVTSFNCAKRILGDKWKDECFLPTSRSRVVNHNMIDAYLIARAAFEMNKNGEL